MANYLLLKFTMAIILIVIMVICSAIGTSSKKEAYCGCPQYLRIKSGECTKEKKARQKNCKPYGNYNCKDDPYVACTEYPYTIKNWKS